MEVFASLKSSGIYLSGETVQCQVTFFNTQGKFQDIAIEYRHRMFAKISKVA